MKPLICFAALLFSGCSTLDAIVGAPIRMHQCSNITQEQAGLRFDAPCWGGEVHARALLEAE
jgi:hypothetical protein